ncbi:tRNA pseudouridine(38-40) synthase TruA [Aestuariibaculum suncheonense]|uniref:tRNA pseudouridine synthase A n=1 Tax=Aestuariibaculum suncheonense TaxID=1028745 RepID=A0A8J6QDN8_9FLAO|nr:tRNA pseudouridine(38-40) synthase TruA [Aestuariibaculum suncheonense]MBD0834732.1 tRNA pseudouridine(38-40) synthase TruA [Aestuariibaculum suncheonense]
MRYFIELSYNGSAYHGWQNQPTAISVQEVIEKGLSTLLKTPTAIVGAGRTDTGVHASQMFAHFDTDQELDEAHLTYKLNAFLPKDVAIHEIFKVKPDAHARFDAVSRAYLYRISLKKNVFNVESAYYVKQPLNVENMQKACSILFDYTDFQCFSKVNTDVKTYNCEIMKAEWFFKDDELHFVIKADRFLRNMVRAIVGTMVNIGLGKMAVDDLHTIIQSKNRSEAGYSVPGHALYLTEVAYPNDIKL